MVHHLSMSTNKTWSVKAVSNAGAPVTFHRHGELLFCGGEQGASISPVEHLLIGVAGCLALSCRAVLAGRRLATVTVEVTATGEKSAEPPSRLRQITLAVRFGSEIDELEAAAIVAEAEKLCTVTNTLLDSPVIEVHPMREQPDPTGH
jgi:uncharacterized OsmC-like protein